MIRDQGVVSSEDGGRVWTGYCSRVGSLHFIVVELLPRNVPHWVSQFLLSYPSLHILSILLIFFLV